MDSIYSLSLLVSLLSGALSVLLSALAFVPGLPESLPRSLHHGPSRSQLVRAAIYVAVLGLVISVTVHIIWGHRPGTPDGLALLEFLRAHPSYLVAAGLPALSFVLLASTTTRSTRSHRDSSGERKS